MNTNHTNGHCSVRTLPSLHEGNAQTLDRKKIVRTTNPISFAGSRLSLDRAPASRIARTGDPRVGDHVVSYRERLRAGSAASEVEGCCPDRAGHQEVTNCASSQVGYCSRSSNDADETRNNPTASAHESFLG